MTTFALNCFKKPEQIQFEEDQRTLKLKNLRHSTAVTYFDLNTFDYMENCGKLNAQFTNVNGNFNVFIGLAHSGSVSTGADMRQRENVYSFSAYDGQKWSSEGGEAYGQDWDKKGATVGLTIDFKEKTLSYDVEGEKQGVAFHIEGLNTLLPHMKIFVLVYQAGTEILVHKNKCTYECNALG